MKIVAFGEVMLRLTVPEYQLLEQSDTVRMTSVGTGVNLLASLAHFGYDTELITALPANPLGRKMASDLRKLGISDRAILFTGAHVGSFFVEIGYGKRPTRVTYQNRLASSFCEASPDTYDWESAFQSAGIVHICGIALSLTDNTRKQALELAKQAHQAGKLVCFDFNYRASLNEKNDHETMKHFYQEILPYMDLVSGSFRDLNELLDYPTTDKRETATQFIHDFGLQYFVGTNRIEKKGEKFFSGFIYTAADFVASKEFPLVILDRIGSGDAFASGIITGIIEKWDHQKTLAFAVSSAVLAQSAMNDSPIFTKEDVFQYLESNGQQELLR